MRIETIENNNSGPDIAVYIMGMGSGVNGSFSDKWNKLKEKVKGSVQKVIDTGKTVLLAPGRIAFLGLVRINVHKLATNLKRSLALDSKQSIKKKWEALGGSYSQLVNVTEEGSKKSPIFDQVGEDSESINEVTIAAALAAAVPILLEIIPLIKALVPSASQDSDNLEKASNDAIDKTNFDPDPETNPNKNGSPKSGNNNKLLMGLGLGLIAVLALKN